VAIPTALSRLQRDRNKKNKGKEEIERSTWKEGGIERRKLIQEKEKAYVKDANRFR
jgi:hypothetical protein